MAAFNFVGNGCPNCVMLDYEQLNDGGWTRKSSIPPDGTYELEKIPFILLKKIIEKFDQRSFARMRRTNKRISNFVQLNRHNLKIPLFHHFDMEFNFLRRGRPEVSFFCPPLVIYEYEGHVNNYGPLDNFECNDFGEFTGMVKTKIFQNNVDYDKPAVTISLVEWKKRKELQRELSGIYHASLIKIGRFTTVEGIELACEFMKFAGLKGMKLSVETISDDCLRALCTKAEPLGLSICNSYLNVDIFTGDCFQTLKVLILLGCCPIPRVSHLKNLEKVQIEVNNDYEHKNYADIFEIVEKWKRGEMPLEEMLFHDNIENIKTKDFRGRAPTEEEMKKIEKLFFIKDVSPSHPYLPPTIGLPNLPPRPSTDEPPPYYIRTSGELDLEYDDPVDACVIDCEVLNRTALLCCGYWYVYFRII